MNLAYDCNNVKIYCGGALECLRMLPAQSVNCCVTSPPYYGLRDYGTEGQIGLESTPACYVARLVGVFEEVRRVLRDDGTFWLNIGDSYNSGTQFNHHSSGLGDANRYAEGERGEWPGSRKHVSGYKHKDLMMIPARLAIALQEAGWYLRSDIIWHKPNPMPESVTDRPTSAHEHIFLLAKSEKYFYNADAIREPHVRIWNNNNGGSWAYGKGDTERVAERGKAGTHSGEYPVPNPLGANRRNVWTVPTKPYSEAHFACYPPALITPCILAGCPEGGTVLDPFFGSGTTGQVAKMNGRKCIGIELNPEYVCIAQRRLQQGALDFFEEEEDITP